MSVKHLLGEFPKKVSLDVRILGKEDLGNYVREKISYLTEVDDRVSAYICIPKAKAGRLPALFCHHQHKGEFDLGKSEVVGIKGDPSQAYAAELAERGFVTFAPDAIAFEERNYGRWPGDAEWFELASRLIKGKTLMAKVLHDVSVGLDYLESREEVDPQRIGFIGHSYGGRMALWVPAFDSRIKASVSNCGCIPYRYSLTHDTGIQMEFCIPGIMSKYDLEDVILQFVNCPLLVSATSNDKWSRGAQELFDNLKDKVDIELRMYEGEHIFSKPMRDYAYNFLEKHLLD